MNYSKSFLKSELYKKHLRKNSSDYFLYITYKWVPLYLVFIFIFSLLEIEIAEHKVINISTLLYINRHMTEPLAVSYTSNMIPWIVLTILAWIVILIFGGCIYAFIKSILGFIFSHGDASKQQKSRDGIQYMVIGLILCLVFLFIFPILFKKAKVEWYEYYTPKNVFIRAGELTRELFSITNIIQNWYEGSKIFSAPLDSAWWAIDTEL